MRRLLFSLAASPLLIAATLQSKPDLGMAEGRCRADEPGPSFVVNVEGLKDRTGMLKLEVYPASDPDFLADDDILISAGKVFRRVEQALPASGSVQLCVRLPSAGRYSVSLLHDRDGNRKFGWRIDGIGFAGNPRLGWSKPAALAASAVALSGPTRIEIVMNYRRGLGMRPIR
ncbi:Uncharacterized conserved protein, DUF2141 family [Sphingomonas sp. NFR04]|uniref:DUF2141 domain-containing protein n=1 Tax=Sphingomonas sp. NFR04 TaxID=1566283 RepID=UPI0008E6C5C5|nr:DUF2141 domain-containing protein [Sphingomonas sp. NFR04]SFJ46465.1 Uncharacterized conserved protein, DUF2141 family [Sphingomonas sp. NFR04]